MLLSVCVNVSARGRGCLCLCVCVGGSLCVSVRLCLSWVVGCLCIFSLCDAIVLPLLILTSFVLPLHAFPPFLSRAMVDRGWGPVCLAESVFFSVQ